MSEYIKIMNFDHETGLYNFYQDLVNENTELTMLDKQIDKNNSIEIITDLFALDLNNRKMVRYLHKFLSNQFKEIEKFKELDAIYDSSIKLLDCINDGSYHLAYKDEFNIEELLKLMDVKFNLTSVGLTEKLERYIQLLIELSDIKYLFIFNSLHIIDKEGLEHIKHLITINKITLIFVEINLEIDHNFQIYYIDHNSIHIEK